MEPLNVKVADKIYCNDKCGTVVSISQRGNAIVWFDVNTKQDDIIVRLNDRAVLNMSGNYLQNHNIYSEAEFLAGKQKKEKWEKETQIWNEVYELMHYNPALGEATFEDLKKIVQKYKNCFE